MIPRDHAERSTSCKYIIASVNHDTDDDCLQSRDGLSMAAPNGLYLPFVRIAFSTIPTCARGWYCAEAIFQGASLKKADR